MEPASFYDTFSEDLFSTGYNAGFIQEPFHCLRIRAFDR